MRTALRRDIGPKHRNVPVWRGREEFLPAPTQGWDTDTPVAELPLERGRKVENFIPKGVALEMRKGHSDHVTGIASAVETLMGYQAGASSVLFAAAGTAIYNVTSAGAVGAAVVTSLTNARFSYVNFTTSGGSFLWICNGADDPRHWNGSAWAVPSLTISGIADNDIEHVMGFKERLFFAFKNTLTFGYLATQAVAGSVSLFPMGAVFNYGGRLVDMGSISIDGGAGVDDYAVFLTSEGEAAVYQGTNPGDATAWALVGVYYVGEPIGNRALVEMGDDLGVITLNGLVSMKAVISGSEQVTPPLTTRIGSAYQTAAYAGQNAFGWEGIYVPTQEVLIVNAPSSSTVAYQFVRHRVTGGWSKFTAWNFACFEFFNGDLYAGGQAGNVQKCFDGYDDDGADITGALETAWSTLRTPGLKTLMEVRTMVTTVTDAVYRLVGRADFQDTPALPGFPASTMTNAGIWGTGLWGTALWGGVDYTTRQWRAISGEGFNLSISLESKSNQSRFAINGFMLRFLPGGQV